jgi:hypothetical protein
MCRIGSIRCTVVLFLTGPATEHFDGAWWKAALRPVPPYTALTARPKKMTVEAVIQIEREVSTPWAA